MTKLLFSLLLIISGLICGYIWQRHLAGPESANQHRIAALRKLLQKVGLLFFMPVSFVAAVWVVSFADLRVAWLPAIGAGALLGGGLLGLLVARILRREDGRKGVLFCCGSFTNIGSIGALVAFVYLGEPGFGLVALYKMFEEIIYYTIGFPIARYYSGGTTEVSFWERMKEVSRDIFVRAAVFAFICGLTLNLSGVPRPAFFETLNSFFVPTGTFILLVSIGLGMRFSSISNYLVDGLGIAMIKFLLIPAMATGVAFLLGFGEISDGLPLKVVLICSSMPVAFTALVAASIYDLDLDQANGCWLFTTASLIITLPILATVIPLL